MSSRLREDDAESPRGGNRAALHRMQVEVPYPPVLGGGNRPRDVATRRATLRRPPGLGVEESYRRSNVRLWLDTGAVDLVPDPAGTKTTAPDEVLGASRAFIISGCNVFGRLSTPVENALSTSALIENLDLGGWAWSRATIHGPQRDWVEAGAVMTDADVGTGDAIELAARFGQGALFTWDDRGLTVIPTGVEAHTYPEEPIPVLAEPARLGCPMRFGDTAAACTRHGGPFGSAAMSTALVWEYHRHLLVDALGCSVCEGGSVSEGQPLGLREMFAPSREGGWQWGPPRLDTGDDEDDEDDESVRGCGDVQ